MEELTRVDPNEDPYLALRTALAVAICVILAEPLGVTQPMMPIVFAMSLMSNQRGALNISAFAGPIALPVMAFLFSWIAAATVAEPMLFIIVNVVLAAAGIALMLFKGSRGGIILTVFPAMMSMSALFSDQALVAIRDSMASGGVILGVAMLVLNVLFPPQTSRVHVAKAKPFDTANPTAELLIRLAVYVPIMLATFATGDMNMLIVPIMLAFVCAEPDRGGRIDQLVDRGGGTLIGALVAIAAMAIYQMVPQFAVLAALITIITYFLIDKMTTGKARPLFYQYICSVALVMLVSATFGARDAFEVVVQRVVLTSGAMVGAIAMLSLLEAIFIPKRAEEVIGVG
ncbi:FUSC family protein [Devosia sp. 2618]|uniref:FUSC family protein n=1 Tax=Devosia sp. 2618 TaxID=3156454 RepID=UPI0033927061